MKIKILEYERYKCGKIRVKSHIQRKGKWKVNKKYDFHKMLISQPPIAYPILWKKEYNKEVN
jgi:hypothetical protein